MLKKEVSREGVINSRGIGLMESEINILPESPLLKGGITLREIQDKFKVKIEHIHNPSIKESSRKDMFDLDHKIELGMGFCFSGRSEDIFTFLDFALG